MPVIKDVDGNVIEFDDLLGCPFCGCDPGIKLIANEYTKTKSLSIKCPICKIDLINCTNKHSYETILKESVGHWNKRV